MPEQEFELYLDLLARLLRMSPRQKEAIASELRDHLEARFEELVRAGVPRDKAIRQALEEFGDTAGLAHQFTQLSRRQLKRWIMRGTLATAAVGAVILLVVNAFLPDDAGGPAAQQLVAQDDPTAADDTPGAAVGTPEWEVEYIDPVQFVHPDLAQTIDVVFDETPLMDAMRLIEDAISLPVVLDIENLKDEGLTADTAISDSFVEDPLYLRLNRALEVVDDVALDWLIIDDVLVVTTATIGEEHLQTVSHDISDFLERGFSSHELVDVIQRETSGPWYDLDGIGGTISSFGQMLVVRQTERVHLELAALLAAFSGEADERRACPAVHAELESALNNEISVDFNNLPLVEAIDVLRTMTTDRIALDLHHFKDDDASLNAPISLSMSNRPLRTILRFMLGNVDGVRLSAITQDGTILITTASIAGERLSTAVFDVSDMVGSDRDQSTALQEMLQEETGGPWFELDGYGGTISVTTPGLFVVRQREDVILQVRSLIRELRGSLSGGLPLDGLENLSPAVDTRSYQMDAEAADDLLTLLPEMVATGTWASTIGEDGRPVAIDDEGIGIIRIVSAGRKVINLSGTGVDVTPAGSGQSGQDETASSSTDTVHSNLPGDVLIVPQAALIIRHRPSVHHQIRHFLHYVSRPPGSVIDNSFIPAFKESYGGGFRGGGFGFSDSGAFYSVPNQAAGRN